MTFAEAVRRVRTSRKLTQLALAERASLTRTHLVRIEGGLTPGPGTRHRLEGALGFTSGAELFAAAGDAESIERIAGYAASRPNPKRPSAAARGPRNESTRWKVI